MGKSGARGGVSFVAIVSVNMGKGVAKLGSNLRKNNNKPDYLIEAEPGEVLFWRGFSELVTANL